MAPNNMVYSFAALFPLYNKKYEGDSRRTEIDLAREFTTDF